MDAKNNKLDLSDCPSCVSFNLRKAMRAVSQHYDRIMAPSGLRGTQFSILTVLERAGPMKITVLADCLVMDRTTLTRNLQPLQQEGYLKIVPGLEDRRSRRVELTQAGKKVQSAAMPYWQRAQDEMVNFLGKTRSKQFVSDLRIAATTHQQL
ncbi:MAG: winged helix-turn-helix transcriptional regulator [Gammaproteobacteria bacterium]|nr:winged helix-turn-helix transcriptional regulator [Gammaproteobacteria bacterium]